jgi:hypothetical protein
MAYQDNCQERKGVRDRDESGKEMGFEEEALRVSCESVSLLPGINATTGDEGALWLQAAVQ